MFVCFDFYYVKKNKYVSLSVRLYIEVFLGGKEWIPFSCWAESASHPDPLAEHLAEQKRARQPVSNTRCFQQTDQAGDHNWKNLFRGPTSEATVTTPVTKHSQERWHKETHWAVVIHFRWALSHEEQHRRPEQQTEERSLHFLFQQEKVERSSTWSDEVKWAAIKTSVRFQSPPPHRQLVPVDAQVYRWKLDWNL